MEKEAVKEILTGLNGTGLFQNYGFCVNDGELCLLGQGGSSYVYEVYARKHPEKRYALKIFGLKENKLSGESFRQMVTLQQRASESSDYVAKILAYEEVVLPPKQGGLRLQCVLMEKLERLIEADSSGQAVYLREELKETSEKLTLINQIAAAVLILHRENVLHRDIKLENIFYDANRNCYKLGDFSASTYTKTGSADDIIYTNGYGAPEIEGKTGTAYDDTADIYSLGIVMYLLWNDLKFPGSSGYYVNPAQYTEDFLFPACGEGTKEWNELIRRMCSYKKEQRHQSMEEVMEEINRIAGVTEQPVVLEKEPVSDGSTILFCEEAQDTEKEDDRYEKKGILYSLLFYYESRSKWYGIALAVLFALLIGGLKPDMPGISDMEWKPQLMLCLAVIEIALLYFEELHFLFGLGALFTGLYFMSGSELYVLYAVLLLGILYGIPMLGTAGVAGVILWNLLKHFGCEGYQRVLVSYHLEWIVATLILLLVNRVIMLRRECAAGSRIKELWEGILYSIVPAAFLVIGVILYNTGTFGNPELTEVFRRIRPGLTGGIVLTVNLVDYMTHRNYPRLGEYMWNEYLGKRGY